MRWSGAKPSTAAAPSTSRVASSSGRSRQSSTSRRTNGTSPSAKGSPPALGERTQHLLDHERDAGGAVEQGGGELLRRIVEPQGPGGQPAYVVGVQRTERPPRVTVHGGVRARASWIGVLPPGAGVRAVSTTASPSTGWVLR